MATPNETKIDEVGAGLFRLSTWLEQAGMVFNQYLLDAEEPLLFLTGQRALFPDFYAARLADAPS